MTNSLRSVRIVALLASIPFGDAVGVRAADAVVANAVATTDPSQPLVAFPGVVRLSGDNPRQQLFVSGPAPAGATGTPAEIASRRSDRTATAKYHSETPDVVAVSTSGLVTPVVSGTVGSGTGVIRVEADGHTLRIPVQVGDLSPKPLDFERDVQPILAKFSCNAGACHGKQRGQNGFQLSLLGFDSEFDHHALVSEARGRRVSLSGPETSLLLQKPAGTVPHGGGIRLAKESDGYRLLLDWIRQGALRRAGDAPKLVRISVYPLERILTRGEVQPLSVTAHYADGSTRDVTHLAHFQSNEAALVEVAPTGVLTAGTITGSGAVTARYEGMFAVVPVSVPVPDALPDSYYAALPRKTFVDDHVWAALRRLGLDASAPCNDATFARRATVDIIGRLPTPDEVRAFLADSADGKRERLVERLLAAPEYAQHQANKWADLLRPNPYRVGIKATLNYDQFIRDAFRKNKPYDQFVRDLITARGTSFRQGQTVLFRDRREPDELTTIVSQLFLGTRLECAKCHHHPSEVWGQEHFYSFAAYFARLGRKGTGLSTPISGSEEMLFTGKSGDVKHPLSGEVLAPRPLFAIDSLGAIPPDETDIDRRDLLAAWITSPGNPLFAKTQANRIWSDMMGVGLVEPVDDLRATNPATNESLLAALGNDFREHGFDNKHLIRRIANSAAYALDSVPTERNLVDTRNYSRHYRTRLRGEVLLDALVAVTEVPESFEAMPAGSSAKDLWTHRIDSQFLDAFGRPDENQDPPCERTRDTTVVQALHVMNSESVARKVTSDEGRAARLAKSDLTPDKIVEELYLACYGRFPTAEESTFAVGLFQPDAGSRRRATEDLLWALLNTPEFWFVN